MKKLLLFAVVAVFGLSNMNAQGGFKVGANAALPIGDAGDYSSFSSGVDVAYFFDVSDKFIVGAASGFTNAFGKTEDVRIGSVDVEYSYDDVQFMPIAAAARFLATDKFYAGADLGYAIGISDDNDGGFYYRPSIGIDMNGGSKEFNISYFAVSGDTATYSSVLAGFLILF